MQSSNFFRLKKFSRSALAATLLLPLVFATASASASPAHQTVNPVQTAAPTAKSILDKLAVKGRAPKTGYDRSLFSDGWGNIGACDSRNYILDRDLSKVTYRDGDPCIVATGVLRDPYTGKTIYFKRGVGTSTKVQIDHVVAVSDAWQKGAQKWTSAKRYNFYNDPLNLLAVDGPTNGQKSDSDAASWLPPNKGYRCAYVSRQIAVKFKYGVWVTSAEKAAMGQVLAKCPGFRLPTK
jgi:hypothetical protein